MMKTVQVFVCLLVVLAGCSGPPSVDVAIEDISERDENGRVVFTGELAVLDDYGGDFLIEDVRVIFESETGDELKLIDIGTIRDTSFRQNVSVTLDEKPSRVVIEAENVNSGADIVFHGLRRNESGGYESFEQDT